MLNLALSGNYPFRPPVTILHLFLTQLKVAGRSTMRVRTDLGRVHFYYYYLLLSYLAFFTFVTYLYQLLLIFISLNY